MREWLKGVYNEGISRLITINYTLGFKDCIEV